MRSLWLLVVVCTLFPQIGWSQTKTLKVGVALGAPFSIAYNNEFHGIAIDIWKLIAEEAHLNYEFIPMGEHIDEAVTKLAQGEIEVLIGPIVPTYERNKLVDFTQPYYLNQIGLVAPLSKIEFASAIKPIFNNVISFALIIFILFFIFYLHIYWYYERHTNKKVPSTYWGGIKETFWLHTLDVDLGIIPSHTCTKQVRFFWLVLLTLFFSSITAAITSALTIALSERYVSYETVEDFKDKEIAAVVSTAPFDIAKTAGLKLVPVNSRDEAFKLLLEKKVAAVVDYYPIAEYYLTQHQLTNQFAMTNVIIKRNTFAFALPLNSPLRHTFNLILSSHKDLGLTESFCEKYFGAREKSRINCDI